VHNDSNDEMYATKRTKQIIVPQNMALKLSLTTSARKQVPKYYHFYKAEHYQTTDNVNEGVYP